MVNVGKQFAAPRKKDDLGWKKIGWMIQNGWRGYAWPTQPKMTLPDVRESLVAQSASQAKNARQQKENESLRERRRGAKYCAVHSKTAKSRQKTELKRQEEYQLQMLRQAQSKLEPAAKLLAK